MKYDDIINIPHWDPKFHKRMSEQSRAAQFAPFSALTGYEEMVKTASDRQNDEYEGIPDCVGDD